MLGWRCCTGRGTEIALQACWMQARSGAVRRDGFGDHAVGAARASQSLPQDLPQAPEIPELLGYRSLRGTSWAPFPSLQSCWAGAAPPHALARSVLEADGFCLSFPGVTTCLAPCRGLLIPFPLLCSPSLSRELPSAPAEPPDATWCHCCCSVLLLEAVPCMCPARSAPTARVPRSNACS